MADIPTLVTKRLRLRAHGPADLDACAAMWGNPAVTKYIGGRPFTREEVWARLLRYAGHWAWLQFGFWLVEDLQSGSFLGEIGLADFKRDMDPVIDDGPEAGWVFVPEAKGKGIATEALQAVAAWSDSQGGTRRIVAVIHPENAASMRVAVKCGFAETRRVLYKGSETLIFVRG